MGLIKRIGGANEQNRLLPKRDSLYNVIHNIPVPPGYNTKRIGLKIYWNGLRHSNNIKE
jgi:hypothetical protein